MESLRRPVVYNGVTYPDYEIDFHTSNVYSKRFKDKDRALKTYPRPFSTYRNVGIPCPKMTPIGVHTLMAETFHDLLPKSPIVSYYGLLVGRDRHILKTPMGFTFICNMVCPDHIDGDPSNNHHSNLMIVTQFENILKCGPRNGKKYKGVRKRTYGTYQIQIEFRNILDENGKNFYLCKTFKTEEEAVLGFNTMLEESLLTIFGSYLGPKLYDLAYKNEVSATVQQEFILR